MSLRIASLPSDVPRASKDCRVCNRRRIRCDRSLPTCKKCAIRKLDCPGYGLRIRWTPGVVSKGKPPGKALPSPEVIPASTSDEADSIAGQSVDTDTSSEGSKPSPRGSFELACHTPSSTALSVSSVRSWSVASTTSQAAVDIDGDKDCDGTVNQEFGIDLTLSLLPLPEVFKNSSVRRLIHHYDHAIAKTMTWVDGHDNPWRTTLLPLAVESPPLLLSILALAGEHLAAKTAKMPSNGSNLNAGEELGSPSKYRDTSLRLLSQQLRTEATAEGSADSLVHRGPKNLNLMLATMLVLCNLEMVQPVSTLWQVHLRAGRTMIQRWASVPSNMQYLSEPTSRFLMREFFTIDVFASTTTFDELEEGKEVPATVLSEEDVNSIFIDYLRDIQEVTIVARNRSAILQRGMPVPTSTCDVSALQARFARSRARTMCFSRDVDFGPDPAVRRDFNHVVEIYYHAGLIYSYQNLVQPSVSAPHIVESLSCLFLHFASLPLTPNTREVIFAQDLVWPLFIAGTESRGQQDRQQCVEQRLCNAMKSTGFSNCQQALLFLHQWWAMDESEVEGITWVDYARKCAKKKNGQTFLIF